MNKKSRSADLLTTLHSAFKPVTNFRKRSWFQVRSFLKYSKNRSWPWTMVRLVLDQSQNPACCQMSNSCAANQGKVPINFGTLSHPIQYLLNILQDKIYVLDLPANALILDLSNSLEELLPPSYSTISCGRSCCSVWSQRTTEISVVIATDTPPPGNKKKCT